MSVEQMISAALAKMKSEFSDEDLTLDFEDACERRRLNALCRDITFSDVEKAAEHIKQNLTLNEEGQIVLYRFFSQAPVEQTEFGVYGEVENVSFGKYWTFNPSVQKQQLLQYGTLTHGVTGTIDAEKLDWIDTILYNVANAEGVSPEDEVSFINRRTVSVKVTEAPFTTETISTENKT